VGTFSIELAASDVAFGVVFGAFVVAFVVLTVITLRWAVRRDRLGRAEWLRRRAPDSDRPSGTEPPTAPGDGEATDRRWRTRRPEDR
jgi:hypothetical protein